MKDVLKFVSIILIFVAIILIMYFCPTIRLIMWVLIIMAWLGLL